MNRRDFLRTMGATGAGVLLAGCEKGPTKMFSKIVPTDDNLLPGEALLLPTTCTECPAACGIVAKIRNGHPVKLEGNPAHPFNRGALCVRGQASLSRLYLPDRIKTPLMKNTDGKFVPIEWDAALARINAELAGDKTNLFLSNRTTGPLSDLVDDFCKKRNVTRLPEYELYSHSATRKANGTSVIPFYNVAKADLLITVGADIVETFLNPVQFTQDLVENEHLRWFHLESHFSLTGNFADERLTLRTGSEPYLLQCLLGELSTEEAAKNTGLKAEQIEAIAAALKKAHAPLLIVGGVTNDLASAVLAAKLQAKFNMPVDFTNGYDYSRVGSPADLVKTEETLHGGTVGVLFVNNTDPTAYRPAFGAAMKKAGFRVGFGDTMSMTMLNCDIVLPLSHSLESWGVEEAQLGTRSVIQPAIKTLHNTRSTGDILLALIGDKRTYKDYLDLPSALLKNGFAVGAAPRRDQDKSRGETPLLPAAATGRSLVVVASLRTFDGRSDVLPVLSEIPDTLSAISFGNFIMMSTADAKDLGAKDKDTITIGFNGGQVKLPIRVQPALPAGVFVVQLPFLKGMTIPVDPQTGEALTVLAVTSVAVEKTDVPLAILSGSMNPDGRGVAPEHDHDHEDEHGHEQSTLYKKHEYKEYRWAMAVDLERCTGCAACVAACYVENNIALVGMAEHLAGREMSWIRLEPFTRPDGKLDLIPMMCQHCEAAPCEAVCPVFATYHNPEGLNAQVYNRCVGTRYCANNCPYKVRRFNWIDHPLEKPTELMLNPDVSTRPAGVMEKCTFCIQRITKAKDHAKDEKRLVRDGEMIPACAQTCPGQAITFGNILDKGSRVYAKSEDKRAYRALEELGTKPAVYYLKTGGEHHEG